MLKGRECLREKRTRDESSRTEKKHQKRKKGAGLVHRKKESRSPIKAIKNRPKIQVDYRDGGPEPEKGANLGEERLAKRDSENKVAGSGPLGGCDGGGEFTPDAGGEANKLFA